MCTLTTCFGMFLCQTPNQPLFSKIQIHLGKWQLCLLGPNQLSQSIQQKCLISLVDPLTLYQYKSLPWPLWLAELLSCTWVPLSTALWSAYRTALSSGSSITVASIEQISRGLKTKHACIYNYYHDKAHRWSKSVSGQGKQNRCGPQNHDE